MFCWYSWRGENMHSPVYLYGQDWRMSMTNLGFSGERLYERTRAERTYSECRMRTIAEVHSGFLGPVMLLMKTAFATHGNTLPNRGMQERFALGPCRTATVRAALHAIAGERVRGDAPGDGAGQHGTRAAARHHALHHGEWRKAGAGGHQRATPDR